LERAADDRFSLDGWWRLVAATILQTVEDACCPECENAGEVRLFLAPPEVVALELALDLETDLLLSW
jgi:hypothetical protein